MNKFFLTVICFVVIFANLNPAQAGPDFAGILKNEVKKVEQMKFYGIQKKGEGEAHYMFSAESRKLALIAIFVKGKLVQARIFSAVANEPINNMDLLYLARACFVLASHANGHEPSVKSLESLPRMLVEDSGHYLSDRNVAILFGRNRSGESGGDRYIIITALPKRYRD